MMNKLFRVALVSIVAVLAGSCSPSGESTAMCSRAPELESSIVAVDSAVLAMTEVSARQLQSMFAVLLSSLVSIGEVAPPEVVDQFAQVERAYLAVSVALQNVLWEGSVGVSDAAVLASIDDLTRNDNVEALSAVRAFITDSCRVDLGSGINKVPGEEVELPSPSIDVEPQPDLITDFYNEESALRSYAYFVAERFGQVLTPDQALCIGTLLSDEALENGAIPDSQFDAFINESFAQCEVEIIVATTIVD
jgi:hypothetical protein